MQNAAEGVVDAAECSSAAIAAKALTPAPSATAAGAAAPVRMPVTGVDLAEVRALAPRQWMRIGLGSLGLGLVLLGFTLRRK